MKNVSVSQLWYFIHDYNAQQSKGLSRHHYYRITTDSTSSLEFFPSHPR
ncbi:hypothetical protein VL20_844 [Microcystis panniformis FACHB-1757]|uniref:Uncharacterized protein n=1 Tax=Microcystis panniformis FACHB-1757 TaxID=1638788 RepID=A0A0K1RW55_9CHRO|nr:hypothetical protein VL20_844 [Microcystis panniformis FACHB-1757]